jgi:hypothetical protein
VTQYRIQVNVQVYPDIPKYKEFEIFLQANDKNNLEKLVQGAIGQFYEDERIGIVDVDSEGNLQGDFKQFFENQVEWRIL